MLGPQLSKTSRLSNESIIMQKGVRLPPAKPSSWTTTRGTLPTLQTPRPATKQDDISYGEREMTEKWFVSYLKSGALSFTNLKVALVVKRKLQRIARCVV